MEMSIAAYLDNIVAREISNGIWFLSNLFLLWHLARFLLPRLVREPWVWQAQLSVKLAWGFSLVVIGSTIRSGWIWTLLLFDHHGISTTNLKSISIITFIAIGIAIWGTICLIKALAAPNDHNGVGSTSQWLLMASVSIAIPFFAHYFF